MKPLETDFSPIEKIGLERPPVGVSFDFFKPEHIKPLETPVAMCEMIRTAQNADAPFYMDRDNEDCFGRGAMGMMGKDDPGWAEGGLIGPRVGVFKNPGANMRCMTHYTKVPVGGINYISFAKLPVLDFEPDLMIFTGPMRKVGAVMRAMAYSTGEMFESKSTPVFQCNWLFAYPYMTGKVNFITMGMGFGTTAREIYDPGEVIVVVPSQWFKEVMSNLEEMEIEIPAWRMGREKWIPEEKRVYGELAAEAEASLQFGD